MDTGYAVICVEKGMQWESAAARFTVIIMSVPYVPLKLVFWEGGADEDLSQETCPYQTDIAFWWEEECTRFDPDWHIAIYAIEVFSFFHLLEERRQY